MTSKFFSILFIVLAAFSSATWAADYSEDLFQSWKSTVGERLFESIKAPRAAEYKVKITQTDLALQLGVGQARISKIVSGNQPISLKQGIEAAKFLKVDPEWLLAFDLIRRALDRSEFPTAKGSKGADFFFEVIQVALGRFSEVSEELKSDSCDRLLHAYSTEDLVEELKARGWNVNLSRE